MNLKPLILIVDDEPQIRRLLTVTLEANAYRVLAAVSGQEGVVLAAQHRPAGFVRTGSAAPVARMERYAGNRVVGAG